MSLQSPLVYYLSMRHLFLKVSTVYAEKWAQEPLARILKMTNIAFKRPVIRLTTSLFLKTMLVHNLEEAVASWKARKSSG